MASGGSDYTEKKDGTARASLSRLQTRVPFFRIGNPRCRCIKSRTRDACYKINASTAIIRHLSRNGYLGQEKPRTRHVDSRTTRKGKTTNSPAPPKTGLLRRQNSSYSTRTARKRSDGKCTPQDGARHGEDSEAPRPPRKLGLDVHEQSARVWHQKEIPEGLWIRVGHWIRA